MNNKELKATVGAVNPCAAKATSLNREVRKELRTRLVNGSLEYVIRTYFLTETVSLGYPFGTKKKVWKYIPENDVVIDRSKVNEPIILANGKPFTCWDSHTDRYNNYYDNSFVGRLTYKEFVAEVKKDYRNKFMFVDFSALSDRAFDSLLDIVSK